MNFDHQLLSQHEREILKAKGPCGEIEIAVCKARRPGMNLNPRSDVCFLSNSNIFYCGFRKRQ